MMKWRRRKIGKKSLRTKNMKRNVEKEEKSVDEKEKLVGRSRIR